MDKILTKIVYIVFQVLKVLLIKISKIQSLSQIFCFLFFLVAVTSTDIIFHKFSELNSTLSEKKIFFTNFPILMNSLPPHLSQNLLRVTKVFGQCSLTYHGFSRLLCWDDARKNQNSRAELIPQSKFNPRVVVFI